jgi:glutathione S-transferase
MLQLYGSTTSPFARRSRLLLQPYEHEFINLDIFSDEGRALLKSKNPTNKIPFLIDKDQVIYDSGVIFRYICDKFQLPALTWSQQNALTLIDAVNDSLVTLLLAKRSGLPVEEDYLLFNLQRERVETVFTELNRLEEQGMFNDWHYLSICLYCLLDWTQFRSLHPIESFPHLWDFYHKNQHQQGIDITDPRNT